MKLFSKGTSPKKNCANESLPMLKNKGHFVNPFRQFVHGHLYNIISIASSQYHVDVATCGATQLLASHGGYLSFARRLHQ